MRRNPPRRHHLRHDDIQQAIVMYWSKYVPNALVEEFRLLVLRNQADFWKLRNNKLICTDEERMKPSARRGSKALLRSFRQ